MAKILYKPRAEALEGVERYKLRPYQQVAVKQAVQEMFGRVILADEPGLGKTGEAFEIWRELSADTPDGPTKHRRWGLLGPALLVCGKNAIYTWQRLALHWGVPTPVHIQGHSDERKALWDEVHQRIAQGRFVFVCVTRETLIRDLSKGIVPLEWQIIFTDEAHKYSNRNSLAYRALRVMNYKWIVQCTGSPLRRGPQDIWTLLTLSSRKLFPSYWRFVGTHCLIMKNEFNVQEVLGPKSPENFKKMLSHFMIRRTRAEVAPDIPKTVRIIRDVMMQETQRIMYEEMLDESLLMFQDCEESGTSIAVVASSILAKVTRLRQILCCPKMLIPSLKESGAALEDLIELATEKGDWHCAVFTPYTKAAPFIRERLIKAGRNPDSIVEFIGGMSPDELGHAVEQFRRSRGTAIVSVAFAESFDLDPALWGYFLHADWTPEVNRQAEFRLDRMSQATGIQIYYARHPGTIDEDLWEILNTKHRAVHKSLHDLEYVRSLLDKSRLTLKELIRK